MLSFVAVFLLALFTSGHAFPVFAPQATSRRSQRISLPIRRNERAVRAAKRGIIKGSVGLGNNADLLYTVPVKIGSTVTAAHVDSGSSDLWLVTDKCKTEACRGSKVSKLPSSLLDSSGPDVAMHYGDSTTGTHAKGTVARDTVSIAGVAMEGQAFGAIDDTNNEIVKFDTLGIFGLGFPSGSKVQEALVEAKSGPLTVTDEFVAATASDGPLLSRIAMSGALEQPMFSVTLDRNTIDISGSSALTIGGLPDGVDPEALTWVPVRLYDVKSGGLGAPSTTPDEVFPYRWEIDIEGVFLDGQRLPDSQIPTQDGMDPNRVSALIDTGNSLMRGPKDVVDLILKTVAPTYNPNANKPIARLPCAIPRTMAFQIAGKMFPVDPRDFIGQLKDGDATTCVADNVVATDPPSLGSAYRWNLGDPFFRSNLVAFYYGNLTHPSVDPPRIGFLSTVPSNADDLLREAVLNAQNNGGKFEQTLDVVPTALAATQDQITISTARQPSGRATTTGLPPIPTDALQVDRDRPVAVSSGSGVVRNRVTVLILVLFITLAV